MKITTEKTVTVPADVLWDLLGERFGEIGSWADAIVASKLDGQMETGAVRTCELKPTSIGQGTIREEVTVFNRAKQAVGFRVIDGLPGFMRHVENVYSVTPVGDGRARVTSNLTIKVAWYMTPMLPVLRRNFVKLVSGFIDELAQKAPQQMRVVEPRAVAV